MRMRMTMLGAVLVGAVAACAHAEVPVAGAPASAPASAAAGGAVDPDAVKVLDILEARGKTLKDFTSNLVYEVEQVRAGTKTLNIGTAALVNDEKGKRFAVVLDKAIADNKVINENLNHQFVFDGQWMIEKDPATKAFRKIEIAKPGEKRADIFGLRGQIPLPIGQKTAVVLEDFKVEKVDVKIEGKNAPAATTAIKLTPKKEKVYDFEDLTIVVDTAKDVELPVRIIKTGLDANVTTFTFVKPLINTGAGEKATAVIVQEPKKEEGWEITVKPIEK